MRFRTTTAAAVLATSIGLAAHPATGAAQARFATISGRVIAAATERPMGGIIVVLAPLDRRTTTDSAGGFEFVGLRPGTYRVEAGLEGGAPLAATVLLAEGERKDLEFRIEGVEGRLPVVVTEVALVPVVRSPASAFERRRATGNGRYFDQAAILERRPHRLIDLLRLLPGVRVECQAGVCFVRLNNDPRGCAPAVFLDEQRSTLSALDHTAPGDVLGLEVYRGPSETPPELNNDQARCGGAIAISTRRGLS
ncbi:MAG: carboxypeptidase-like regulatory domain-containing protein [Gemmatimonadales bacterium]